MRTGEEKCHSWPWKSSLFAIGAAATAGRTIPATAVSLGRLTLVVVQQPAEPLVANDILRPQNARVVRRLVHVRRQAAERLVGPEFMVVADVFLDQVAQVFLAQHNEVVEHFGLNTLAPPFGIGILVRSPDRGLHELHALGFENRPELLDELCVPITDKISGLLRLIAEEHAEIPGLLGHPTPIGVCGDPGDVDPPSAGLDEEEHEILDQATQRPDLLREEVAGPERLG